jgi:hypothetical protein
MVLEQDGESWTVCVPMKKHYKDPRRRGISYIKYNDGRITAMVTTCTGTAS